MCKADIENLKLYAMPYVMVRPQSGDSNSRKTNLYPLISSKRKKKVKIVIRLKDYPVG